MSEAYERERQNNSRLDELASKVTALRGVTIDIYDNARQQDVIDSTVRLFPPSPSQHSHLEYVKIYYTIAPLPNLTLPSISLSTLAPSPFLTPSLCPLDLSPPIPLS